MTFERWQSLMRALGLAPCAAMFDSLVAAYAERQRHYHTGAHIKACLKELDACAALAERPAEIELALWFHDAVYRPLSGDNERRSAEWAVQFLTDQGAPGEMVARVRGLILATQHSTSPETADESLLLDVDLAILGADAAAYAAYEAAIRQEYRMVPMPLYRRKRAEVLNGFLHRPNIYHTNAFQAGREQRARVNLANAVRQLAG